MRPACLSRAEVLPAKLPRCLRALFVSGWDPNQEQRPFHAP